MSVLRKQILLIPVLQFLLLFFSHAQNIQLDWVRAMGTPNINNKGVSLVLDSNKSVIVTGEFTGTVDFDAGPGVFNLTSNGRQDNFITEYDSSGNFVWAKNIGSTIDDGVREIKMDAASNLYIIGFFQALTDFDPGPAVYTLTASFVNTFILKLDNNGNFIWVKQMPYTGSQIDIDAGGNIVMGGWFEGTRDFDPGPGTYTASTTSGEDMFVQKFDNSGNFLWMHQIRNMGGGVHQQAGLETDTDNNIFFAGNFTVGMHFDPGNAAGSLTAAGGGDDAFLLKLDAEGDFVWVKRFGAAGGDKIFGLEMDNDGNAFSTGQFYYTVDFDPGPATYFLSAQPNQLRCCFILKLDPNGNFVYAKNFQSGESFGRALAIDSSNDLYVAGGFNTTVDFDPGTAVYNLSGGDLFTVKLDAVGNFVWAAGYGTPGSFESIYGAIKVDILKNVYFTGAFPFTVDFDPNPTIYNVTAIGEMDIFIHKLNQCNNTLNIMNVETCSDYTLNNTTYSSSGVYYQTLTNSTGCDSIIQLNLSIGNTFNQVSVSVCDSYVWNGNLLTNSGIYRDTFNLSNGCDSIVELNLIITKIITNLNETACGSYLWEGNLLTNSGIYRDTLNLNNGCDSVVVLNLVIKEIPLPQLGRDTTLCKGETIILSPGVFNEYLWSTNSTANTLPVTDTGTYWVKVKGNNGCSEEDTIKIQASSQCACILNGQTKIYPTPFSSFLIIDKNPTNCEVRLNLYNALGQLLVKNKIIHDGLNDIPLKSLSAGMYFYKLHSDGNILLSGKILKQ